MNHFYILYGLDQSLINQKLKELLTEINTKDIIKYNMEQSSVLDVIEDLSTVSMFSEKKVIIMENCFFLTANKSIPNLEKLEDYIEQNKSSYDCIMLVFAEKIDARKKINKLLKKYGKIMELNKADDTFLIKYVKEQLKGEYQMEDISYFLKKAGSNLNTIQNELQKLMMYQLESKKITNQDVDLLCMNSLEEEIFVLTDAIIAKDIPKSLSYLKAFLNQNYDEIQIILLLASQFRFLFQVKRLSNKGKKEEEIAKILEANPYRIKFNLRKVYSYSEEELLTYIHQLAKMDHDIKLGLMDKHLALEMFIIQNKNLY